jgi:hypothetical protein
MIGAFEPDDREDLIRVWCASTIPGQSFLPEEHWRAMDPEIRDLTGVGSQDLLDRRPWERGAGVLAGIRPASERTMGRAGPISDRLVGHPALERTRFT